MSFIRIEGGFRLIEASLSEFTCLCGVDEYQKPYLVEMIFMNTLYNYSAVSFWRLAVSKYLTLRLVC